MHGGNTADAYNRDFEFFIHFGRSFLSDLFFKKFLTTFDAIKLGKTDEKIASRRRVSVNNEPKPSINDNNEGNDVRTIDISDTILGNLRDATPIESGRTLEF